MGAHRWSGWIWIALAPVLYFAWLFLYLILSAIEFQVYGLLWPKPRRMLVPAHRLTMRAAAVVQAYQRNDQVRRLPFAWSLLRIPVVQRLVLLSYAPRSFVGRDVLIYGNVYDPELTRIGDAVVIGGDAAISAHTMVNRGASMMLYASAPIVIETAATIGGESRVAMGTTIGRNAVIEPGSVVEPFTQIPANQVWGGSPARYRREVADDGTRALTAPIAPLTADAPAPHATAPGLAVARPSADAARRLVADALDLPLDAVGPDATADDVAGWDSLGQLVIAMLARERYGVSLDADAAYCLRSVADVDHHVFCADGGGMDPPVNDSGSAAELAATTTPTTIGPPAGVQRDPLPPAELLPLLDRAAVTRALAREDAAETPVTHHVRVVIAATFTAQPIETALRLWTRAFGIDAHVEFAAYGQAEAALLSRTGVFVASAPEDVRVLLVRAEDLAADAGARATRAFALLDAADRFASDHGSLIVGTLPPPLWSVSDPDRAALDELRSAWRQRLERNAAIEILNVDAVAERLGTMAARDARNETTTRNPWSADASRDLGIELARAVRRRFIPPRKVIAVDCDGTLWRGVIAEDGIEGIGVGADGHDRAFQLLQGRIRALRDRGVLIALVSRNEPADVWRVFDEHPGMILRRDDIAASRIAWRPKSTLLRELADELSFSLDAFVLLDDDPVVRSEVEANAPGVLVLPLPADPIERPAAVADLWSFDGAGPTAVDLARTRMVREERERSAAFEQVADMETYLRDLDLEVSVGAATPAEVPRVAQLTQRTNQFNTSLRRRTVDEIRELAATSTVLTLSARDRYGDYGLVGVAILAPPDDAVSELDSLLLSCRALGRGIEDALLHVIAERARGAGANVLRAACVLGPRNAPALEFLRASGFAPDAGGRMTLPLTDGIGLPRHVRLVDRDLTPA